MNSLVLITAMSMTSGLFGGKHCGQPKHHAKRASSCYSSAPCGTTMASSCYSASPCGTSYATPYASHQSMTAATPQGYPTAPAKMTPMPASVPPAPPVPPPAPPMATPSSALAPTTEPAVATGDIR